MLLASARAMAIRPGKRGDRAQAVPVFLQGREGAILARLDGSDDGAGHRAGAERSAAATFIRQV